MKYLILIFALLLALHTSLYSKHNINNNKPSGGLSHYFFQNGNINTVFGSDGVFNYDRFTFTGGDAGFIWPASSNIRLTEIYSSGFWIGTKLILPGNQRELRFSGSMFDGQFTPGIIPVPGFVPPQSICNDTLWKGYLVSLKDSTLINGGARNKSAGGRNYSFNYSSWYSWPVNHGAPYVEVNNIQGYQPGWNSDRPGIGGSSARPDEILFMIFMDYTNCTDSVRPLDRGYPGGTRPIGIELHQLVFMFDHPALNNAYFIKWKIINKSAKVMDSTYIGIFTDADIGYASDDVRGCDSVREIGFVYNYDNEDEGFYGTAPPALGYCFLQTPLVRTNLNTDTGIIYCDTLTGYRNTGMTTFSNLTKNYAPCLDPSTAERAYNFMKGLDGCGMPFYNNVTGKPTKFLYSGDACNRIGWIDSFQSDKHSMIGSGPFVMQPMDTQIIVASYFTARGNSNNNSVCRLLQYSDDIKALYGLIVCGYPVIGINGNSENVPVGFKLKQNYPNPFNPATEISYDLKTDSYIRIEVFDLSGRLVKVLYDGLRKQGNHTAEFDGTEFSSGVYFCRLSAGEYTKSIKMILLK